MCLLTPNPHSLSFEYRQEKHEHKLWGNILNYDTFLSKTRISPRIHIARKIKSKWIVGVSAETPTTCGGPQSQTWVVLSCFLASHLNCRLNLLIFEILIWSILSSFELRLRVSLAGNGYLTLISRVRNVNSKPFSFSFAYHTYYSVSDIRSVTKCDHGDQFYISNFLVFAICNIWTSMIISDNHWQWSEGGRIGNSRLSRQLAQPRTLHRTRRCIDVWIRGETTTQDLVLLLLK